MLKKSLLILFILFAFLCIFNVCFATNTTNNVKNAVSSTTDAAIDGVSNLAHDVRNGIGHVENGIEDALTINNTMTNADRQTITTNNYQTTRTADMTRAATGIDTKTMWVWLIVAVASVIIISLVWYYGYQNRID